MFSSRSAILWMLALAIAAAPSFGYTYKEVLDIYRVSGRELFRNQDLAEAMRTLRDSRILYLKSPSLQGLMERVETDELLGALERLHAAKLLPPASPRNDTVHDDGDVLVDARANSKDSRSQKPLYRAGRVTRPIPYYEKIRGPDYYILGGLLDTGTEFEVAKVGPGAGALLTFDDGRAAYIARRHISTLIKPEFMAKQDPSGVLEKRQLGPATYYRVRHRYAPGKSSSLSILWLPLGEGLTIRPHVTSAYDLVNPGSTKVDYVHEMGRRSSSVAALNGTFFINSPGKEYWGKPLGPILKDGRLLWSHDEKRVLDMKRSYIAVTTDGTVVMGDTSKTGRAIERLNREGSFLTGTPSPRRVRHLLGGLGWLIRNGDPMAWEQYAGTQFWYTYYSYHTKRPQTVVGVTEDGRGLVLLAQEGRPHSSRPMSLPMLAHYMKENFPIHDAVFLDGGGSTDMAIEGRAVIRPENNGGYRKGSTALLVVPNRE